MDVRGGGGNKKSWTLRKEPPHAWLHPGGTGSTGEMGRELDPFVGLGALIRSKKQREMRQSGATKRESAKQEKIEAGKSLRRNRV